MIALSLATFLMTSMPSPEALSQNQNFLFNQLKSESPDLRMSAIDRLGELKSAESISHLAEMLDDADPEVRFHAIRALAKNPTEESKKALESRLPQRENDPYLKAEIQRSAKNIDDTMKTSAQEKEKKEKRSLELEERRRSSPQKGTKKAAPRVRRR